MVFGSLDFPHTELKKLGTIVLVVGPKHIIVWLSSVACPGGVLWVLKHPAHADPEKKKEEEKKKKEKERKKEKEKEKERKPMITKNI